MPRRDVTRLAGRFDLVVVGAGILGAWAALDAALRGLTVALVERDDFAAGTSANSLRIIHGGLRYLGRGDLRRMRESVRERSILLRAAPHLVRPLDFLVPTHGLGVHGRPAMRAALLLNDLLTLDRNRGVARDRLIGRGRVLDAAETLRHFPALQRPGLTGGAMWEDAQLLHSERLIVDLVHAASERGAVIANRVSAESLVVRDGEVRALRVRDRLTGTELEIETRAVLCAAGAANDELVARWLGRDERPTAPTEAVALNLLVARRLADVAVGVRAPSGPEEDPVCGGGRYIFATPWRELTLLGTWYAPLPPGADPLPLVARGIDAHLAEFNGACPELRLSRHDVLRCLWGMVRLNGPDGPGRPGAIAEHPPVRAPAEARGLLAVEAVKYTTARAAAVAAVDRLAAERGLAAGPSRSDGVRLGPAPDADADGLRGRLARLYGRRADEVAALAADDPELAEPLAPGAPTLGCEVVHAVRNDMAIHLDDVALRRTDLASAGPPDEPALAAAAALMARELGWSPAETRDEVARARRVLGPPARPEAATR